MTAQFPDQVQYNDHSYSIAGQNGEPPFAPEKFNLKPVGTCTACWRGYVCHYVIRDNVLYLDQLYLSTMGHPQILLNVVPQQDPEKIKIFDAYYEGITYKTHFTGGLLLGDDFINELYVHMGFHPAWKFRNVYELIFEDGHLIQEHDRSEAMLTLRKKMGSSKQIPLFGSKRKDIKNWISQCFSLEYEFQ
jgi:hypothetical protein